MKTTTTTAMMMMMMMIRLERQTNEGREGEGVTYFADTDCARSAAGVLAVIQQI